MIDNPDILSNRKRLISDQVIHPYIALAAMPTEPDTPTPKLEMYATPLQRDAIYGPIMPFLMLLRVDGDFQKPSGKPKNRR
jgi:hypothetical protein